MAFIWIVQNSRAVLNAIPAHTRSACPGNVYRNVQIPKSIRTSLFQSVTIQPETGMAGEMHNYLCSMRISAG